MVCVCVCVYVECVWCVVCVCVLSNMSICRLEYNKGFFPRGVCAGYFHGEYVLGGLGACSQWSQGKYETRYS